MLEAAADLELDGVEDSTLRVTQQKPVLSLLRSPEQERSGRTEGLAVQLKMVAPIARLGRGPGAVRVKPVHDFDPDGRRARDPAHIPHRLAGEIPGPDADGVIARVSDAPVIAHVLARPGFHGGPEARGQRALHAEGPA